MKSSVFKSLWIGSIIYSPDEGKIEVESIYRPAVDPTGAGDSYKAGFVSRLIYGASLEEAAKFASSVSSFVVEKQGCQTNMPTYDDAYNRMMDFYNQAFWAFGSKTLTKIFFTAVR